MNLLAIPKAFYYDHEERDLPTPKKLGITRKGLLLIAADDPALPELLSDARHYSNGVDDCGPALIRAARNLVAAITEGTNP